MLKILSIDGGGIRGVLCAFWLRELESRLRQTGRSLHSVFDVFAGTSTGAIISTAIANDIPGGAETILDWYKTRGSSIFRPQRWLKIVPKVLPGVGLRPKYQAVELAKILKERFPGETLGDVAKKNKRLLVTAFDAHRRSPRVFDSKSLTDRPLTLRAVCKASAAAPTYFSAHEELISGVSVPFLDGGLVANNPTGIAVARALQDKFASTDLLVVSMGTGDLRVPVTNRQARDRGWLTWSLPIIDMLFDGSNEMGDEIARALLSVENYFRFQTSLSDPHECKLDGATPKNIEALEKRARNYWESSPIQASVDKLIPILVGPGGEDTDLDGAWKSEFDWESTAENAGFERSSPETVQIEQIGKRVLGRTNGTGQYNYQFDGVLKGNDVLGSWQSIDKKLLFGTFQLRLDIETNNELNGYWIGSGNSSLYNGHWKLTRQQQG